MPDYLCPVCDRQVGVSEPDPATGRVRLARHVDRINRIRRDPCPGSEQTLRRATELAAEHRHRG